MQRIQVGNGQFFSVLFIIPVIINMHEHRFENYALISEIHENVDLILEVKNIFELEGVIIQDKPNIYNTIKDSYKEVLFQNSLLT